MKGQTATELIMAVVIIVALIVVGIMGGIPGIGNPPEQEFDNPKDCESVYTIHYLTPERPQEIYDTEPHCFEWGGEEEHYFVKCCEDKTVNYKK